MDISSATVRVASNPLKAIAILSDSAVRKTLNFMAPFYGWGSNASRLEPLRGGSLLFTKKIYSVSKRSKTTLEIREKLINKPIINKFFKDCTYYRKKTNRAVIFCLRPLFSILKYKDHT